MKKLFKSLLTIGLSTIPIVVGAQGELRDLPPGPRSINDLIALLNTIANWIFSVLLAVAVIFILWAALDFVTGGGDPGKVTTARQKLLYAIVGIVVAVAAKGIVYVASNLL